MKGPKSICVCGHTGDGSDSQHKDTHLLQKGVGIADLSPGMIGGHGPCAVKGCDCKFFTWKEFIDEESP